MVFESSTIRHSPGEVGWALKALQETAHSYLDETAELVDLTMMTNRARQHHRRPGRQPYSGTHGEAGVTQGHAGLQSDHRV
jgi:hypothetical protein